MYIPIFYKLETINQDKLQDVLMGNITAQEADELRARMKKKRRRATITLVICVLLMVLSAAAMLMYEKYEFADGVMLAALAGIFLPLFVSIFQAMPLTVAGQYLRALKFCRPDSRITFTDYRKYSLGKNNKPLLEKIRAASFNPDEASGIRNMGMYNRGVFKGFAIFSFIMCLLLAAVAVFATPFIFELQGETERTIKFMVAFPRVMSAILGLAGLAHLYRISICQKYITAVDTTYAPEQVQQRERMMDGVIARLREETATPTVSLTPRREATTPFSSKLGGMPYLPPGFPYPLGSDGRPLRLLAQLNFGELPKLPDFPQTGILQFYIADNDTYGLNFGALTWQQDFRVVYHADIQPDIPRQAALPYIESEWFPFSGEFALVGESQPMPISSTDYRFSHAALPLCQSVFPYGLARLHDLPSDHFDRLFEAMDASGHRMGGYPYFTQTDPREQRPELAGHTVMLLQIDSQGEILWGDSGVANFFIEPERLRACDFSNVIYTWDCY